MSIRFSESERDHIRSVLIRQKRQFGLSDDGLIEEISRQLNYELEDKLQLDRKTLERFLKNEKRTADVTVGIYKQYVESLPEPDPTYEFGDAFADFFGLPDSAKERRAYMDRMVAMYEGTYDVWDVTDGTPDENKPDWELTIKPEPYTSFLHATEKTHAFSFRLPFEGIVVPREKELTIFMKEEVLEHEKIYVLRLVEREELSNPNAPTAFFGNVMEKKLAFEREKEPKEDLTRHYKVLASRVQEYDENAEFSGDEFDQGIAVPEESEWEEHVEEVEGFEEIEEFNDTEDSSSHDEK